MAGQSTVAPGVHLRTRLKGFQGADGSPLFSDPPQRRPAWALRGSPAVWQQPGRDMLFCLNPPHSLPFPHWPDGATLPAATAADVSCACSSRTHLPGPRHTAVRRRLSGPGEVAANSRARRALGDPDSGEGTRAEGASFLPSARPSQARAEVGGTRGPSPAEAERPRRRRLPFLTQRDPGAPPRPALKREGNLVYRRGAQPFEPLSEKSASLALAAMCAR